MGKGAERTEGRRGTRPSPEALCPALYGLLRLTEALDDTQEPQQITGVLDGSREDRYVAARSGCSPCNLSVGRRAGISGLMTLVPALTNLQAERLNRQRGISIRMKRLFWKLRMEIWLAFSAFCTSRALTLAMENDDLETVLRIHESLVPWVSTDPLIHNG